MAKSIEEQKEEARKHRMDLFGPCFGVFFLLTYGSIIAPYQEAMKRALKNKDGSDADLQWTDNIPIIYTGFERACKMHQYDDPVSPKAFATDWYELTREEYRNEGYVLNYDEEGERVFYRTAKSWLETTGGKIEFEKGEGEKQ